MTVTLEDLLAYLVSLNPGGRLGAEEGVLRGPRQRQTESVLVTWMPTVAAIRHAITTRCPVIISHEALTFHDYFPHATTPEPWTADRARLALLDTPPVITVIRAHSTIDPTHIVPAFVQAVGLTPPVTRGTVWSLHREPPTRLADLARRAAAGLGMAAVRVTGAPERVVTCVGTMVGGLGQDRHLHSWERYLMGTGVEAIVAGETNDFAQRFALDSGIGLIETCHSASEEPGLAVLAADLRCRFPGLRVESHRDPVPWTTL
jgi:putative NIF3 family GTP cyclohydrolase 1 type 2